MLTEAITWLIETLTAAGLNASADPATLNLPGVWVTPSRLEWLTLSGPPEATLTLYLVGQPAAGTAGLDALAAQVLPHAPTSALDAVAVSLPNHNAGPLPAYSYPLTVQL